MEKIQIDPASNIPLVHQVSRMIRSQIVRGELEMGEYLPSVRDLGSELGVNFNTVAKAYRQLEKEDLIEIRHGLGARIKERVAPSINPPATTSLLDDLDEVICQLSLKGSNQEQVVDFFAEALGQHYAEKESS